MDGLVSTGNKIPTTILLIISANQKNFTINFIHIFFIAVDKGNITIDHSTIEQTILFIELL